MKHESINQHPKFKVEAVDVMIVPLIGGLLAKVDISPSLSGEHPPSSDIPADKKEKRAQFLDIMAARVEAIGESLFGDQVQLPDSICGVEIEFDAPEVTRLDLYSGASATTTDLDSLSQLIVDRISAVLNPDSVPIGDRPFMEIPLFTAERPEL